MIDLSKLKVRTKANRKAGGSRPSDDYVWKFRRFEKTVKGEKQTTHEFKIGNQMWEELELSNHGLTWALDEDNRTSYIQVVAEKNALVLRGTASGNKQPKFKADTLEEDLIAAGVVPASGLCEVELNIEKVETGGTVEIYSVFAEDTSFAGDDDYSDAPEAMEEEEYAEEETN